MAVSICNPWKLREMLSVPFLFLLFFAHLCSAAAGAGAGAGEGLFTSPAHHHSHGHHHHHHHHHAGDRIHSMLPEELAEEEDMKLYGFGNNYHNHHHTHDHDFNLTAGLGKFCLFTFFFSL